MLSLLVMLAVVMGVFYFLWQRTDLQVTATGRFERALHFGIKGLVLLAALILTMALLFMFRVTLFLNPLVIVAAFSALWFFTKKAAAKVHDSDKLLDAVCRTFKHATHQLSCLGLGIGVLFFVISLKSH